MREKIIHFNFNQKVDFLNTINNQSEIDLGRKFEPARGWGKNWFIAYKY